MSPELIKFLAALALWLCIVGFGMIPILVKNFRTNKTLLSLSNCFSGGLFIAIGLIHILPEAHNELEGKWKKPDDGEEGEEFPLSYVLCLATFSFILLIDKVFFNNTDIAEEHVEHDAVSRRSMLGRSLINTKEGDVEENFKELTSHSYKAALRLSKLNLGDHQRSNDEDEEYHTIHDENHAPIPVNLNPPNLNEYRKNETEEKLQQMKNRLLTIANDQADNSNKNDLLTAGNQPQINVLTVPEENNHVHHASHKHGHHDDHGHHGHHHATVKKGDSYLSAYIILTAMGIHGIFAGLAFGVSKSQKEIFDMFIAMIAHKWSEALTVGISFVNAGVPTRMAIIMMLFLSSFTPIGIFIGYWVAYNETVAAVCKALSAGTFIYISCAEIIIEEFAFAKHKFWKFLMYTLGILFVIGLGFLE